MTSFELAGGTIRSSRSFAFSKAESGFSGLTETVMTNDCSSCAGRPRLSVLVFAFATT